MERPRVLVLGLGNDLLSDDGFGPAVANACRGPLADRPDVVVEAASVAGFHLLDVLAGFDRVLILDAVQTGQHPPGTLMEWPLDRASAGRTLGGSHQTDLASTLELGRMLGQRMPSSITLWVVEAKDLCTLREELTPEIAAAVPRAVDRVHGWVSDPRIPLEPPHASR